MSEEASATAWMMSRRGLIEVLRRMWSAYVQKVGSLDHLVGFV